MKRFIWLIPALLLLCATARAQETPAWELGGNYSYLLANTNGTSFHLHGGGFSITQNLNSWFGGRFQLNAYSGTEAVTAASVTSNLNVSAQTYTYGPVFSYRKFDRVVPYADAQFGMIHASQGYLGISSAAAKFAMNAGGGLDFKVGDKLAIRGQGDYLMSRYLGLRQDNFQFSVGIVYRLGKK